MLFAIALIALAALGYAARAAELDGLISHHTFNNQLQRRAGRPRGSPRLRRAR